MSPSNPSASADANKVYEEFRPSSRRWKLTTASPFTPHFLQTELPASSNPSNVYTSRIKGKQVMLENPVRESRAKVLADQRKARREKDAARRKTKGMGRSEAKRSRVWEIDPKDAKWDIFLPIHHLWLGYMTELLGLSPPPSPEHLASTEPTAHKLPPSASIQSKLVKADLHGSILTVKRAKNPDLVGCSGLVVHETENTFKVVTREDSLKVIPKRNSVFALRIPLYAVEISGDGGGRRDDQSDTPRAPHDGRRGPEMEFEMYGNQLCFRASDRASRKFKFKETIEL